MTELHHLTLAELNEGLRARRFSSVELTKHFLARIERLNPVLPVARLPRLQLDSRQWPPPPTRVARFVSPPRSPV